MCAAPNPCVNEMYDHPWCVAKSDIEPGCTCMPFKTGSYCELDDETGIYSCVLIFLKIVKNTFFFLYKSSSN